MISKLIFLTYILCIWEQNDACFGIFQKYILFLNTLVDFFCSQILTYNNSDLIDEFNEAFK